MAMVTLQNDLCNFNTNNHMQYIDCCFLLITESKVFDNNYMDKFGRYLSDFSIKLKQYRKSVNLPTQNLHIRSFVSLVKIQWTYCIYLYIYCIYTVFTVRT